MSATPVAMAQPDLPSQECPICHRSIPEAVMYCHSLWCRQTAKGPLTRCKFNRKHRVLQGEADKHQRSCPCRSLAVQMMPMPTKSQLDEDKKKVRILQ